MEKMDSAFGVVESRESLLEKLYDVSQRDDEDVSEWGCRLDELLVKAAEKEEIQSKAYHEMLSS